MKGIRKLFLGLIFLTLFGVGFKVEAKAKTISITEPSWTSSTTELDVKISVTEEEFPVQGDPAVTYSTEIDASDGSSYNGPTIYLCFPPAGSKYVEIDGQQFTDFTDMPCNFGIDRSDVYSNLGSDNSVTYTPIIDGDNGTPVTVTASKINRRAEKKNRQHYTTHFRC